MSSDAIGDRLQDLSPVSLTELDERASLLHRVDQKYVVDRSVFLQLLDRLGGDHDVLDIDGRRCFRYRSVYFDTPDLRCFWDHVNGCTPRFKARTRVYEDTGECVFEVKLKPVDGETDKRQIDHPAEPDALTASALGCFEQSVRGAGLTAPDNLRPTLETRFRRLTLAARDRPERLTCDLGVHLSCPTGGEAAISDSVVLLESKTEDGCGAGDRALAAMGIDAISLSKYRVGIGILAAGSEQPGSQLFAKI